MEDFYKYIQVNSEYGFSDLRVVNAGHTRIVPGVAYPPGHHPDHHYFNFQQGRVIDEYQLIFISEGQGVLDTQSAGRTTLSAGQGFILFPDEWHRYKPDKQTGWIENWVGFSGEVSMLKSSSHLLSRENPVFRIGVDDRIFQLFNAIFDRVKTDVVGSEYVLSGVVIHMLGYIATLLQRQALNITSRTDEIILTAKSIMERQFSSKVKLEEIADELKISYAWFRKYFRRNTGFSPYDYLLNIRINHAKFLLKNSGYSVKEICMSSGFESQQQFCRTFKKKTGKTPVEFRKHSLKA
ncbi:MAG: AraC family transcriptional regulator [Bacteroidales bacterium]|nr:AraC family transcriptional regulator [Bacteroidales bacterium]